ncbi:hypothetical protein [Spirosoma aerophilum]
MLFKKIAPLFVGMSLLLALTTHAQTLANNTDWLKQHLNSLVTDKEDNVTPIFNFSDCQMMMAVDTKEDGIAVKMNMNWPLKEIKKVSYKPAGGGKYTLLLDIPGDKVKGKMKVGIFSKKIRSKGEDGHSSFTLNTTDEKLVQEMKQRFDNAISQCRSAN